MGAIGRLFGLESSDAALVTVQGHQYCGCPASDRQGLASGQTAAPVCSVFQQPVPLFPSWSLSYGKTHKQGGGTILGSPRGKGCVSQSHREVGSHRRQKGQHKALL